jgi:hypothetical protein
MFRSTDESRPLAFFAGIWTRWKSVRKVKEGETENDLSAFLTTEPNGVVAPIHPSEGNASNSDDSCGSRAMAHRTAERRARAAKTAGRRRAEDRGAGQEGGRSGLILRTVNCANRPKTDICIELDRPEGLS